MEEKKTDNPYAFPTNLGEWNEREGRYEYPEDGMTLRDYFAANYIIGKNASNDHFIKQTAKNAYKLADAMLEARNQPPLQEDNKE